MPCCSRPCGCSCCATCPSATFRSARRPPALFVPSRVRPAARLRAEGGRGAGVPAGVRSRGRVAPRRPDARPADPDHRRHPHRPPRGRCPTGSSWRAASDEFRELADDFDAMLARLEAHVAEQRRFAANASHELRTPLAITQTLLEVARNDPDRDSGELVERLHAVNARAIDLTEALLLLSRADQRSFTREPVDLSLIAEEATETLLPLAEKRGVDRRDLRRRHPDRRLACAAAAADHEPRAQRDRPQPARAAAPCGSRPALGPEAVVLTVENTGEQAHPAAGRDPHRAVPARHRTHPQRPRRRRPRPGHRQEHHPARTTERSPSPRAPTAGSASRCNCPLHHRTPMPCQRTRRRLKQLLRTEPLH